jgi:hypothetical protein
MKNDGEESNWKMHIGWIKKMEIGNLRWGERQFGEEIILRNAE